ncbi:restriction endonuclease, partial [Piscirickettsiaceae bacterium NZ-RLO2]
MAIPKHNEIRALILELLAAGKTATKKSLVQPLSSYFNLTEDETTQEYESGNGLIFHDRISWALSFLSRAGLDDRPKRGNYRISEHGLTLLSHEKYDGLLIGEFLLKERLVVGDNLEPELKKTEDQTPHELLASSHEKIKQKIYDEILDTIILKTPREFEHLVVKLLKKMGYGGQIQDAGMVTQSSNDGGIDGIIKEDILGLGRIHVQAKRYKLTL